MEKEKFCPRLTEPEKDDAHYYGNLNIFSASGVGMEITNKNPIGGNCTAYAWGRLYELTEKRWMQLTGNAEDFYVNAKKAGLITGNTPKRGAIICWKSGLTGTAADGYGHVAVVEHIYEDGSIIVSESGWNTYVFKIETIKPGYSRAGKVLQGFIYCGIEFDTAKTLTETSYPDYAANSGKYYRIRKEYKDYESSKGSYSIWSNAFNVWKKNKITGYHVFNCDGKQLD